MRLRGERAFGGILAGQLASTVGSAMTRFALVIWTLAETGDTTAYSLLLLASFLPLGPALASVVLGAIGLGAIFIIGFVTFGASVAALLPAVIPSPPR